MFNVIMSSNHVILFYELPALVKLTSCTVPIEMCIRDRNKYSVGHKSSLQIGEKCAQSECVRLIGMPRRSLACTTPYPPSATVPAPLRSMYVYRFRRAQSSFKCKQKKSNVHFTFKSS